jgi:NAD(P)-dependent dehydrogenase (short-subunit alcohol dehydrogenase family)
VSRPLNGPWFSRAWPDYHRDWTARNTVALKLSRISAHVLPIGWVEPEDISNAIFFLSSDGGRYIPGITLPVDECALLK